MKVKNILILFSLIFSLSSCVKDFGNYDYQDSNTVLPVTISGMKDTSILKGEYLMIAPEVTLAGDTNKYRYSWYVIPLDAAGSLPTKTVWSRTKNLNHQVTLAVGSYYLNLSVTDSVRDIYVRKEVILRVKATEVGAGWFVLKDVDNETDVDYIKNDGTFYPDILQVLADPAGSRLKGKAIRIEYQPFRYNHQVIGEDGKVLENLTNQSVYHIISDEDIKIFNSKDLKLFKNNQDLFYTPTVCRPQNIRYTNYNLFVVNDGKISAIYGLMANIGKVTTKAGFYTFHDDLLAHGSGKVMGFDMDKHTFYHVDPFSDMTTFRSGDGQISTTNMNVTLLNLLTGTEGSVSASNRAQGFAIMKSLDKEEYYLATLSYNGSNAYPIAASASDPDRIAFDTVPQGCKMPKAPVKAAPYSGNFVYFAEGNKLSVYRNALGLTVKESLLKEFPAGETISYIANVYKSGSFNRLAVLTNSDSGWKLYAFNILGLGNPEFDATPAFTRQGAGNAKFVMYRD